jgi:predicted acylesterase/phospholipase RssA
MLRIVLSAVLAVSALAAGGCRLSPFRHIGACPDTALPGDPAAEPATMASDLVTDREAADGLFVGVGLSGGGSRAAVYAAEILDQLHRRGVMARVDYLSTVSGGSIAGAYYCLSRDPGKAAEGDLVWEPAAVHRDLTTNFWAPFIAQALNPLHVVAYCFTGRNRSGAMADVFDHTVFHGRTLGDLNSDRPKLLINATRLDTGQRFTFTDASLGALNVRTAPLRVADAVQASAAFPGFFQPRTFPKYARGDDGGWRTASYLHLMDGGAFDNLGLDALAAIYRNNKHRFPKGAVFILVDSSRPIVAPEGAETNPDLRSGIDYVLDIVSASAALDTVMEMSRIALLGLAEKASGPERFRVIHLYYPTGLLPGEKDGGRDRLPTSKLVDLNDPLKPLVDDWRQFVGLIAPTNLAIDEDKAEVTRAAARRVLERNAHRFRAAGLPVPTE